MLQETARVLDEEQAVIGWFQGRLEWGPRSLGARSILADSRNRDNWQRVNLKVKFRESFRPFAPACLAEKAGDWFDIDRESPYMLLVCQVKKLEPYQVETSAGPVTRYTSQLAGITHVDGSARLQTVRESQHAEFYGLLKEFDQRTGCPVLINTSFNVRGEPIVCTPEDAYLCFMRTNLDVLVLGNQILRKADQPELVEGERRTKRLENKMGSLLSELWQFMRVRKKWWLGPIVVTLFLLSALIVLTQGSAVAPFIYTLF
jgi:carbamoyltransferase